MRNYIVIIKNEGDFVVLIWKNGYVLFFKNSVKLYILLFLLKNTDMIVYV